MKRWLLFIVPVAVTLAVAAAYAVWPPADAVLTTENAVSFAVAGLGSFWAARAFGKGDYLRLAWGLMGLCYVLLFIDVVAFGAATSSRPTSEQPLESLISGGLTLLANVSTVVALVRVSRAWTVAGLDFNMPRALFWGSIAGVVALSLLGFGPNLAAATKEIFAGHYDSITHLTSTLGDVVATAVLVPLFLTARSLRGGALVWPWGLLAASTLVWLGVDGMTVVTEAFGPNATRLLPVEEGLRLLACLLQAAAAKAQLDALEA